MLEFFLFKRKPTQLKISKPVSLPIKMWGKSVKGFLSYDWTSKQTYLHKILQLYISIFKCSFIIIRLMVFYDPFYSSIVFDFFNPIAAGYLKTRIRWEGGGNLTDPSLNPMFDIQIWQMIHHWKALLESAKPFENLQKLNFLSQNPVVIQAMCLRTHAVGIFKITKNKP